MTKERLGKFFAFAGISETGGDIKHVRNHTRANMRLMQPYGFAYAAGDHTGFQQGSANTMFQGKTIGWAIGHEIGHHFDMMGGKIPETTNNMWANYNIVDLQGGADRVESSYDTIFRNHASYDYANLVDPKAVNNLTQWWQLHLMNENYWPNYQKACRDGIAENMGLTNNERMVAISSYAVGVDVTEHFLRHKYIDDASAEKVRAVLNQLNVKTAEENIKPWYLWTKATRDRVSSFGSQVYNPQILFVGEENGSLVLQLSIEPEAQNALLGYEVLRDGQVIGFTRTDKFSTTTVPNDGQAHTYKVRAFDLRLNTTGYSNEVSSAVGESVEAQNLAVATENINKIKDALKNALSAEGIDFKTISEIYIIQPKVEGYQGNETDMLVVQKAEEALLDNVAGNYMVTLAQGNYETVDELLANNLVIMYRETAEKPFYVLKNGAISKYQY